MAFVSCEPGGPSEVKAERTCWDVRSPGGSNSVAVVPCKEGCYCQEGYIRVNESCLSVSECGCLDSDDTYMQKGEVRDLEGCGHQMVCGENGKITKTGLVCDVNADCSQQDGNYECICRKGYFGDGTSCQPETCLQTGCGPNEECVNGQCQCLKGYMSGENDGGSCRDCKDIDECATKTHDCIHHGQYCVNTNGSYTCACSEGFTRYGNYCQNINECHNHPDLCGPHSECVDLPGSYVCGCCAGFKMENDVCVPDPSQKSPSEGQKCCSCVGDRCQNEGPVCGKNGKSYPNEKSLIIDACLRGDHNNEMDYSGICQESCANTFCDQPFQACKVNNYTGQAQCVCPSCGGGSSQVSDEAVCSSRNVIYRSECEFQAIMCSINDNITTIVGPADLCSGIGGSEPVGPWTTWSNCSSACGQGTSMRSRKPLRELRPNQLVFTEVSQEAACYVTCSSGPCFDNTCSGAGQVCIVVEGDKARCICPDCRGRGYEPVCGLVGSRMRTYENECELKKAACQSNRPYEKIEDLPCEKKPINCTKYGRLERRKNEDGTCETGLEDWGMCAGGCGSQTDKCCQPTNVEEVEVTYHCMNGSSYKQTIDRIQTCSCLAEQLTSGG